MKIYRNLKELVMDGVVEEEMIDIQGHDSIIKCGMNCMDVMKPKFIEYVEGESLSFEYPVEDMYLNIRETMQGGFITAAFDNTFGGITYMATKNKYMASINLNVDYHRPIFKGDALKINACIKSLGKTIIYVTGEAYNRENKLIASATSNIMLL